MPSALQKTRSRIVRLIPVSTRLAPSSRRHGGLLHYPMSTRRRVSTAGLRKSRLQRAGAKPNDFPVPRSLTPVLAWQIILIHDPRIAPPDALRLPERRPHRVGSGGRRDRLRSGRVEILDFRRVQQTNACCNLWPSERQVVRRALDAEVKATTLRLQVQHMGQNRPTRLDFCRDRDQRSPAVRLALPTKPSLPIWCGSQRLSVIRAVLMNPALWRKHPERRNRWSSPRSIGRCWELTSAGGKKSGSCSGREADPRASSRD
jgi:hypothetical protein